MTIEEIYSGAEKVINQFIRKESDDQGHYLTGAMNDSLDYKVVNQGKASLMEGFAAYYAEYVNDGVPAASASMKQFPFLVEYFNKRGFPEYSSNSATLTSQKLAAMTIHKWMKEGMSTQASKRFSSTGSRQHFVENAFTGNESKIDDYMSNTFDFAIDEEYHKEKSETI